MIIWITLLRRLRKMRAERTTFIELNRLDDRILRDINVSRSEIGWIARNAANKVGA